MGKTEIVAAYAAGFISMAPASKFTLSPSCVSCIADQFASLYLGVWTHRHAREFD